MITLKDIESLILRENSPEHLSKRVPKYWKRYEGQTDKFAFDLKVVARCEVVFRFLVEKYFRIQVRGVNNIPAEGRVILAGNHSGTIPIDALMAVQASFAHHTPRRIRYLVLPWFKTVPPVFKTFSGLGAVEATFENALTLLNDDEIVGIYPEADRAMTKNWTERYQLRDFDPGFVKLAIATQTPIVPVITIGAEETYPNFANWEAMAKLLETPIFPITLTFPWLPFPLAYTPMPARWLIRFGKPIKLNYSPDKSFDKDIVAKVTAEIKQQIQEELNTLLAKRKSILTGWDEADLDTHDLRMDQKELERVFDLATV